MKTFKSMFKRYSTGMDALLWINVIGVYFYCCIVGSSDIPALVLLAGLNTVVILITKFDEIRHDLTPKPDADEVDKIVRRVK